MEKKLMLFEEFINEGSAPTVDFPKDLTGDQFIDKVVDLIKTDKTEYKRWKNWYTSADDIKKMLDYDKMDGEFVYQNDKYKLVLDTNTWKCTYDPTDRELFDKYHGKRPTIIIKDWNDFYKFIVEITAEWMRDL